MQSVSLPHCDGEAGYYFMGASSYGGGTLISSRFMYCGALPKLLCFRFHVLYQQANKLTGDNRR